MNIRQSARAEKEAGSYHAVKLFILFAKLLAAA